MLTLTRALLLLIALPAFAAVFPEDLGEYSRGEVTTPKIADAELYKEYTLQSSEQAQYSGPKGKFTATAWHLRDTTGALALFDSRRPANGTPSNVTKVALKTAGGALLIFGNYVFEFAGYTPTTAELDPMFAKLPELDMSALPALPTYLPAADLIPNSERYILGPVSLARFAPQITPSLAGFSLSAEGQLGRYKTPKGELTMVIFNYPIPNLARERQEAFLKVPGMVAKRAGPMVAVIASPGDADAAEVVLSRVQYDVKLTRQDIGKGAGKELANLVLTGFLLAGVIGGASLLAGLWLGGSKWLLKRFGWYKEPEAYTLLRLHDKGPKNNS